MSETYQPTPDDIEAAESHLTAEELSRSNFRAKLKEKFDSLSDESFELYKDEEKRGKLRFDVESVCRHAIAMKADYIIFLDKAARGYGLLANKMLPILRLEFAERENLAINDVPDPEIKFYNDLHIKDGAEYFRHNPEMQAYEALLKEKFHFMDGKRVLVFDESTNSTNLHVGYYGEMTIDDQYDAFSQDIRFDPSDDAEDQNRKSHWQSKRRGKKWLDSGTGAENAAKLFYDLFPGATIDYHLGTSGWAGGHDLLSGRAVAYGIEDDTTQDNQSIRPFIKRHGQELDNYERNDFAETGFESVVKLQSTIRKEHSMIAKESFDSLIK